MHDAQIARLRAAFGDLSLSFWQTQIAAQDLRNALEQLPDETKEEPESEPS